MRFAVLLVCLNILPSLVNAQTQPEPLEVNRIYGITSSRQIIDNRSITANATYFGFVVTGSGTWTVSMQWSDTSNTGPWTIFGSTATLNNLSSGNIGYGNGFHKWISFAITGTVSINYSATRDFYLGVGGSAGFIPSVTTLLKGDGMGGALGTTYVDVVSEFGGSACVGALLNTGTCSPIPTVGYTCVEGYANDGMNGDYGQIVNAAVVAQPLLAPSNLLLCTSGQHPVSTTIIKDRPVTIDFTGSFLIPQAGGGGGAWGSAPVILNNSTVTAGSTAVTVSSTAGLTPGMAIGGIGMPSTNYIAAASGTTVTLGLPAVLDLTCMATASSTVLTACSNLRGVAVGQTVINTTTIPSATTIASINYATQAITMSAAATASNAMPINVSISGSWTATLTAQSVAQVAKYVYNVDALRNPEGQNYLGDFVNLTIQDPGLSVTCTETASSATLTNCSPVSAVIGNMSVSGSGIPEGTTTTGPAAGTSITITNAATASQSATLNVGVNLGRTLTGVQGVQISGWDNVSLINYRAYNLDGSELILGGYNASPNAHNGLNRESYYISNMLRDGGDYASGQPTLAIMSGEATGDDINQIGLIGVQAVCSAGEALSIVTYNLSRLGVSGLGPRLIWAASNSQFEGCSHYTWNLQAPYDLIGIQQAADFTVSNSEINAPGYTDSVLRQDHATTVSITNSRVRAGAASATTCTVNVQNGSTTVGYGSGCSGGFDTSGKWDGTGWRATDSGACSGVCNVYLAPVNAVTSATSMTLASPYQGSTGGATFLFTPGGYFIKSNNAASYIFSSGTTGNQASANTLAAMGVTAAQTFFPGVPSINFNSDLVQSGGPGTWFQNLSNIVNPRTTSGTLLNIVGNNIQVGGNGGISYGDILGGQYNGVFMSWVKRGLGSSTNSNYMGLNGAANFFAIDPTMMGWGTHTQPEGDNWNIDASGNSVQAGNATIGGTLATTGGFTTPSTLMVASTRTTSGSWLEGTCGSLAAGTNCGITIQVDGGTLDSGFVSFVFAGASSTSNRIYSGINGGTGFVSWNGSLFGFGSTTSPTTDAFHVDTTGDVVEFTTTIGGGSTINKASYIATASITPTSVTNATCSDQTFTLTGVSATTDHAILTNYPVAGLGGVSATASASAANQISIHFCNPTAAPVTPPSGVYTFVVLR